MGFWQRRILTSGYNLSFLLDMKFFEDIETDFPIPNIFGKRMVRIHE